MAKDEDYFIRIENPKQARRLLLENTRDVLKVLKNYEEFKRIREKRGSLINTFKSNMNEVRYLIQELKKILPKTSIKEVKRTMMPEVSAMQKPGKELKKFEQELADIEEKLESLS